MRENPTSESSVHLQSFVEGGRHLKEERRIGSESDEVGVGILDDDVLVVDTFRKCST